MAENNPSPGTLAQATQHVGEQLETHRLAVVEDNDHRDGRYYTFVQTQLDAFKEEDRGHAYVFVEADPSWNAIIGKFRETHDLKLLDILAEYDGWDKERQHSLRDLIVDAESRGVKVVAVDVDSTKIPDECLKAMDFLEQWHQAHPDLTEAQSQLNAEYQKNVEILLVQRHKDDETITDNVAAVMKADPLAKGLEIIGGRHAEAPGETNAIRMLGKKIEGGVTHISLKAVEDESSYIIAGGADVSRELPRREKRGLKLPDSVIRVPGKDMLIADYDPDWLQKALKRFEQPPGSNPVQPTLKKMFVEDGVRFVAVTDHHDDSRDYTFVASQLQQAKSMNVKNVFVEVTRDAQPDIDAYLKTGNEENLQKVLKTLLQPGVKEGVAQLLRQARHEKIQVYGMDLSRKGYSPEYIAAVQKADGIAKKLGVDFTKPVTADDILTLETNTEFLKANEVLLAERAKHDPLMANYIAHIMKDKPGENAFIVAGEAHFELAKDINEMLAEKNIGKVAYILTSRTDEHIPDFRVLTPAENQEENLQRTLAGRVLPDYTVVLPASAELIKRFGLQQPPAPAVPSPLEFSERPKVQEKLRSANTAIPPVVTREPAPEPVRNPAAPTPVVPAPATVAGPAAKPPVPPKAKGFADVLSENKGMGILATIGAVIGWAIGGRAGAFIGGLLGGGAGAVADGKQGVLGVDILGAKTEKTMTPNLQKAVTAYANARFADPATGVVDKKKVEQFVSRYDSMVAKNMKPEDQDKRAEEIKNKIVEAAGKGKPDDMQKAMGEALAAMKITDTTLIQLADNVPLPPAGTPTINMEGVKKAAQSFRS